jgi:hypothetical protein
LARAARCIFANVASIYSQRAQKRMCLLSSRFTAAREMYLSPTCPQIHIIKFTPNEHTSPPIIIESYYDNEEPLQEIRYKEFLQNISASTIGEGLAASFKQVFVLDEADFFLSRYSTHMRLKSQMP